MIAKGLSALLAGIAIFVAAAFSQPSPSSNPVQLQNGVTQTAVAVEPITSSGSGSIGNVPQSSDQLQAPSCTPSGQTADKDCKSGDTYDYTCRYGQPDKAHPTETCMLGASCSQVNSGTTFSGTCCGPQSCALTKVPTTQNATNGTPVVPSQTTPPATNLADTKSGAGSISNTLPSSAGTAVAQGVTNTGSGPISSTPQSNSLISSAPTNSGIVSGPTQSGSQPLTSQGPVNIGSGPISNVPTQTFNGSTGLNNITSPITSGGNSFSPSPVYSNSSSNLNSYAPTSATFNGSSGVSGTQTYNPTLTASSPLTNLFSSVGNLNSFFNYVGSVFIPTDVAVPVSVATSQSTQIVTTISTGQNPQLTKDYFTGVTTTQSTSWQQQPSSYIDLITGDQQTLSPIDIATIIQGSSGETNPTEALVTQVSANSPIQTLLEQQTPTSLADNSSANLQIPEISSLALNTTNGLENYQNVPEQFYIEEAQLAQAQNDYEWLQAQIAAWENAKDAGVCDDACQNALSVLESEVPGQYQQVQQLQGVVDAGPFASVATTSSSTSNTDTTANGNEVPELPVGEIQVPGAGQAQVVADNSSTLQTPVPSEGAPYYVKQNDEWCDQYDQCIPASAFQPAPVTQVVVTNPEFTGETSTSSAPENPLALIAQTVQGWINNAVSIFTPNTAASSSSQQSCSLFKSLFGGCGSNW